MADYVYLKNVKGQLIKPVTDLAAINMTTTNGIAVEPINGGTIGIRAGYIESAYYTEMVDADVGPGNVESAYIEGGTMYTLLGGYTISQDVPGQNPSPYKVPSEQAVRAAIDAYVATGGTDIVPGKAINVSGGSINVTTAEVEDVLDETTPVDTKAVTPEALLGALSVGQAVDVSCAPYTNTGTITYGAGGFLDGFTVTMVSGTTVGFYDNGSHSFPKFAKDGNNNPLHYIFIADVSGTGTITPNGYDAITLSNTPQRISTEVTAEDTGWFSAAAAATVNVANWRQYEVTALTAEAKEYIASAETNPDPDALFRSTNAYSILNKYLIKQDMVSPFIPIINMDNKNVTIGAGLAYSVKLTDGQNHDFTVDTIPANGYGWDSHLQLFIAGAAGATFVPPLALMDPLTPNAGHNITIKWRAGQALAYVDDTDIGYVVSIQSGTENGTLYYGLKNETVEYVVFAGALDGQVIDVTGDDAFVTRNANLIGNGVENTLITGTLGAANSYVLRLQNLSITGDSFIGDGTNSGYTQFNSVVIAEGSTCTFVAPSQIFATNLIVNGTLVNPRVIYAVGSTQLNISGTGIIDNAGQCIYIHFNNVANQTKTISGVTITNGYGVENGSYGSNIAGGGIFATNLWGTSAVGKVILTDVTITGCTGSLGAALCGLQSVSFELNNCNLYGNSYINQNDEIIFLGHSGNFEPYLAITDCTIGEGSIWTIAAGAPVKAILSGNNKLKCKFVRQVLSYNYGWTYTVKDNAILDCTGSTHSMLFDNTNMLKKNGAYIGDNVTLITPTGTTVSMDACEMSALNTDGTIEAYAKSNGGAITLTTELPVWHGTNLTTNSNINAAAVDTVKLSGVTFTAASQTRNTNRIQLPAASTNSFTGNTLQATDKILDAGLIVVGDDPSIPGGTATINYVTGTTVLSGIGTYIAQNGTNDFTATSKVVGVSTDAAFATALTATTGTDGTNKFIQLASGSTVTANYSEGTNVIDKTVITNDYEPIIGGTWRLQNDATITSLPSLEVTADKHVKVKGGVIKYNEIYGGKDVVVDLNGGYMSPNISGVTAKNLTITNGSHVTVGGFRGDWYNCTFEGNDSNGIYGPVFYMYSYGAIYLKDCVIKDNIGPDNSAIYLYAANSSVNMSLTLDGCVLYENQNVFMRDTSAMTTLTGTNKILSNITGGGLSHIEIAPDSVIDIQGNTNTTPLAPGGWVVIPSGTCTVITSAGSSVSIASGIYASIDNAGATTPLTINNKTLNTDMLIPSGSTVTFAGTDTVNSTVSGEGTMACANGATVTSTIPQGGTIGTGVISTANINGTANNDVITFENVTFASYHITSVTEVVFDNTGSVNATFSNVAFSNITVDAGKYFFINRAGGVFTLTGCSCQNVSMGNSNSSLVYAYNGVTYLTDCTGFQMIHYKGWIVLSGTNQVTINTNGDTSAQGGVVFTPGSVTTMSTGDTIGGTGVFAVGTFANGTVTVTGTATLIIGGTTVEISGSGTVLDNTGIHS